MLNVCLVSDTEAIEKRFSIMLSFFIFARWCLGGTVSDADRIISTSRYCFTSHTHPRTIVHTQVSLSSSINQYVSAQTG